MGESKTTAKRVPNPTGKNGRDPHAAALRALAREHTAEAVGVLVEAMRCNDLNARMAAATQILDRAWGKPSAQVDLMRYDWAQEIEQAQNELKGADEYGIDKVERLIYGRHSA